MTCIEYDGTKYAVPFVDLLPPLKKSERLDLEASLKAGVDPAYPVEVYDSPTHGPNTVIDGANRLRLCSAHRLTGLAFVRSEITDDEEARRHAIDVNSARRQMDSEAIQAARTDRVQRVAEARAEGKSLRTIAEDEGVSPEQVRQDVKAATVKGLTVEPEKVKGRDGKVRTAKPKRKKPEPVNQPEEPDSDKATAEPTEPESTVERLRRESLENVKAISDLCYELDAMAEKVSALGDRPGCWAVHWQSCRDSIKSARSGLWAGRPNHACPYCKATGEKDGKECKGCRGLAWVRKGQAASGKSALGVA